MEKEDGAAPFFVREYVAGRAFADGIVRSFEELCRVALQAGGAHGRVEMIGRMTT